MDTSANRNIYNTQLHLRLRDHFGRGDEKIGRLRKQKVCCEVVSPRMSEKSHP